MKNLNLETRVMGRTSKVVSPLFEDLLAGWFGLHDHPISSSNAGEQGMTLRAATTLRFSSGFSVETFQLLDLLFHAATEEDQPGAVIFQQYLSKSPHFHEKKGERHIKKMIEESLGCFFSFEAVLPALVKTQLQKLYDELRLERVDPIVYPALQDLPLVKHVGIAMSSYALFSDEIHLSHLAVEMHPDIPYHPFLLTDTNNENLLARAVNPGDLLLADVKRQDALTSDMLSAD